MENTKDEVKYILPIDESIDKQDVTSLHQELIGVLDQFYYTVSRVDLLKNTVCIIQCAQQPKSVSQTYDWTYYLGATSGVYVKGQRRKVIENFSAKHLLELYESGETTYSMEAAYMKGGILNSMTLLAFLKNVQGVPTAYILVRNSTADHIRKRIVDIYVYDNCDFFVYLDAQNNSYTKFSKMADGRVPVPNKFNNYEEQVIRYTNEVIIPEERERVRKRMSTEWVMKKLEDKEVYSFSCGAIDKKRGYARKRIDFRYYEREAQVIMLTCTDITDMYLEEQAHCEELANALKRAQTDMLTGLLNYQGTVENISKALEDDMEHAALLFMDMDNFKNVNDTMGHAVGDIVLKQVSGILRQEAFGEPMIGRIGGDEFIIFFSKISSMKEVEEYARRVCNAVMEMDYGQDEGEYVSCSIGIVEVPEAGCEYKTIVKKADDMVYRAKSQGKNRFVIYAT